MLYSKIDESKTKEVLFLEFNPDLVHLIHRYKRINDFPTANEAIEYMILKELNLKTAK